MRHEALKALNEPVDELFQQVETKALMRLKYEKLQNHVDIVNEHGPFYQNPSGFAMKKYAYYQCFKCGDPYYGGEAVCLAAGNDRFAMKKYAYYQCFKCGDPYYGGEA